MININHGRSPDVMAACPPLDEYARTVEQVRRLERDVGLEAAIDRAIDDMPGDYLIQPFLEAHKAEVKNMLLTEYNETRQMELFKEEGRKEGIQEGIQKGRREGLREGHQKGRQEGLREGEQKGQNKLTALISRLFALGRGADVERAAKDAAFLEKLFAEFGIH